MHILPQAFAALDRYRQFIVYRLVPRAGKPGKMDKLPITRTREVASAHDPAIWLSSADAMAIAGAWGPEYGVGFVFTEADPFWFLDIDNCLQSDNTWSPLAQTLIARLAGAAVEVSQSGRGLHIIGTGTPPPHGCKPRTGSPYASAGLEFYHAGRFAALTGTHASGDAGADLSASLPALVAEYFPPDPGATDSDTPAQWTAAPVPGWGGPADDDELIALACTARGNNAARAFGGQTRATFLDLWMGDPSALGRAYPDNYGNRAYDASSADAALASHLAFWTGKDCERIDRLMRQSGLVRDKWDKHRGYMRTTIMGAVGRCDQVYGGKRAKVQDRQPAPTPNVPAAPVGDIYGDLMLPPGGKLNTTLEASVMVAAHLHVAFDEFKQRVVLLAPPPWKPNDQTPRNWTDADTIETQAWLQAQLFKPSKDATADAVFMIAHRNVNHPVKNYLDRLEWDGTPRIDGWLARYMGAESTEYTRAIGAMFLIAAVARIYQPGCKADNMLILEGSQGIGKSTAVLSLSPSSEWFTDELPDVSSKDAAMQLHGAWIVEVAELDAMNKAETSSVKKFISRREDRYRPPYGRSVINVPRQSLFIGTTNEEGHYFKDQTGNRRYWPVATHAFDVAGLVADRDQLWAEAVTRYRTGEKWHFTPAEAKRIAHPEQDARREIDPWEPIINERLGGSTITAITANKIATDILKLSIDRLSTAHGRKIAGILRRMGWVSPDKKQRIDGAVQPERVWYRDPNDPRIHFGG